MRSQEGVTTLGIQVRPIIVSDIAGNGPFDNLEEDVTIGVRPGTGLAWGMLVRRGFTESISLEFGITRSQRNFTFEFEDLERGFSRTLDLQYINYDIPIRGLVFVQLGKQTYLSNSLGGSFVFFPTNVATGDFNLQHIVSRFAWAKVALEGNLGIEYRTKKSGWMYGGIAYHNPFSPFGKTITNYLNDDGRFFYETDLNAGYLTLDFRYYFHEDKER